jgi:hypothetical protein
VGGGNLGDLGIDRKKVLLLKWVFSWSHSLKPCIKNLISKNKNCFSYHVITKLI